MSDFVLTVIYILTGVVGLCVGSFLNVVIYRVPEGMSLAKPDSHCPKCKYKLKWYDNIPILSYIILGGKCRGCGERISFRYTAVEIANTLLWLLSAFLFVEKSIVFAVMAALASSIFIIVFFIDLEHMLVFNRFVLALALLGFGTMFSDLYTQWYDHLIGLVVALFLFGGVFVYYILRYTKEAMGGGDIKLAMAAGFFLGWQRFILAIIIASLSASIVLLIVRKKNKHKKDREYPFAPFLVSGFAVAMFVGDIVIPWYMNLLLG